MPTGSDGVPAATRNAAVRKACVFSSAAAGTARVGPSYPGGGGAIGCGSVPPSAHGVRAAPCALGGPATT
eukprot:4047424-Pleurochrysis_carterae.AAC.1